MDTTLLDAAFQLVSHSITSIEARLHALTTDEARLTELRRRFPQADPQAVQEAYARARRLEEVSIEMADTARNQRKGRRGRCWTRRRWRSAVRVSRATVTPGPSMTASP